jgi:hypothetical protein
VSLATFLRAVVEILEDSGVPHMLTGSLASAYYAAPRATQDVDLVIDIDPVALDRVVARLREAGYYVDQGAARQALESKGQFNAIDPVGGWKVDLIIKKDRLFSRTEFDRRTAASLLGVEVSLASLEDVLLAKLEWSQLGDSELQRRDVVQLLERSGDRLNLSYVERWVGDLGLSGEWEDAKARAQFEAREGDAS